jgi:glutamine synthetase
MSTMTKDDIRRMVEEQQIHFIRMQFSDSFGFLKNVAVTASQLDKVLNGEIMFDGSSIDGFARIEESDMYLKPDLDSFAILPWSKKGQCRTARLICDVYTPAGVPFSGDPRYILSKVLKEAQDMGYSFNVGPELEFFLLETNEHGEPLLTTNDQGSYFDLGPIDKGEIARQEMCLALEDMGFEIEASHHECAPGQHEIDFRFGDALTTADRIMTFKMVAYTIANALGLHATFMPKPIFGVAGSGMHNNMSLFKDGQNVFCDEKDPMGLSELAYNFVAGLMKHAAAMTAITNPLVNSYKRLVPGYEAPCYIAWSAHNRSPLIRIPSARGNATRIEMRNPDPSCNPYLIMALALAAGLDGIKRGLKPVAPVDNNIYDMTEAELKAAGIANLPSNLQEAIDLMEQDALIRATLGDHLFNTYIRAKRSEWKEYTLQVQPWEIERYLKTV